MLKTLILWFFFLITNLLFSQCPTGDVNLGNQSDVDFFLSTYPTCEIINGDLLIGSEAADISGLTSLKRIEGSLRILYSDITSVSNFSALEFIGGDFEVKENTNLTVIENINQLETIGGELKIHANFGGLKTIKGFDNLASIGFNFTINFNPPLQAISGFNNLTNVSGSMSIANNDNLLNIPNFNKLLTVGDALSISSNDNLMEINGFNFLETIGSNLLIENSSLISIKGFSNLKEVTGLFNISGDFSYPLRLSSIPQFNQLEIIGGGFNINYTRITNLSGFDSLISIGGSFGMISNNNLITINGFNNLNHIYGVVQIITNNRLKSIIGFNQLVIVGGLFQLNLNSSLTSLIGLENLVKVAGPGYENDYALIITDNISLTDCSAICDLLSSNGITGLIEIVGNPSMCSSQVEIEQDCIPDFDDDGILNDDDLDDDNDGILDIVEQNGNPNRDTDGDGYPDHQDLDSDNDGCSDVVEGGFTDSDGNGTLGSLPDTVDANGLIIGEPDGYTIPLDSNFDSIFDFQQANTLSAGENGNLEICINSSSVDLFDSLTSTPDTGGVWTPSLTSGSGMFDPSMDTAGIYTYTVTNGVCGSDTSEVNVTIDVLPNAGEDGNLEICINSTSVDLFDSLTGTPDTGGVWTPSLTSGTGIFNPSMDTAGVYTYTVTNGICGSDASEVNVIITNVTPISDYEIKIKEFSSNNSLELLINSNLEYEFSLDGINYQSNNVFNNLAGGDYTIYVEEVNGCGVLETLASILDYPKFFTPNNDGFNDVWNLKGKTNKNYSIYIYDRYGKLLKNLTSPESSWDGTFNGSQLPTNDYWFKVVFSDGIVKSGHFTLKR